MQYGTKITNIRQLIFQLGVKGELKGQFCAIFVSKQKVNCLMLNKLGDYSGLEVLLCGK